MSFFLFKDKIDLYYINNIMMSKNTKENIDNLLYYKIDKLLNNNKLDYIKNDIFENLRLNHKMNFYVYNDIYNYLNLQLFYNRIEFTQIKTIEELQNNLKTKFNKFIDKNYIKKIFMKIKKNKYS